ncbi:hypothetical protein [Paraburkholderia sp. 40]|uniref:hypothetical protein n=1 Tax=Paraburkholderia sp. 40 TaxID=2991059 RepID=UPI003D1AB79F
MLQVTVELLPFGDPDAATRKHLGKVEIVNVVGDRARASYEVRVFDQAGERIATGHLENYPRFATTVWDLVARGVATALAGREELPARPLTRET